MDFSIPGKPGGKIRFAIDDTIYRIERLSYTDIVGDIRDPENNPNYGEIALLRYMRLNSFYNNFIIQKYFYLLYAYCF